MRTLILIRHAESKYDPNLPPRQWGLTGEGRARCKLLAERLASHPLDIIVTSLEPKARETGEIVARFLDLPCTVADNLHEQAREGGETLSHEEFIVRIANLFANPERLVFGLETAQQALKRFRGGVEAVMADYQAKNTAIVTHGTVMSLFFGEIMSQDAYQFWRQLGLPAFYTVSWPDCVVLSQVMEI
jgi:broad specificity phosphatase PhoE